MILKKSNNVQVFGKIQTFLVHYTKTSNVFLCEITDSGEATKMQKKEKPKISDEKPSNL